MSSWRFVAAIAGTVLAIPAAPPAPPTGTPLVACPAPPAVARPTSPPPPSPPALDAAQRATGGPALATRGLAVPAPAPKPPAVTATSWLVADLDNGAVLGACGAHEYRTPASVQKLLLAATMMPRLDPTQIVEVTRSDMNYDPESTVMGLALAGHYSVETLWRGCCSSPATMRPTCWPASVVADRTTSAGLTR